MSAISVFNLLREHPAGSFSDLWYRIGPMRLRLSVHARIVRQRTGRREGWVIENPATGQYYRLSEPAWLFAGLLDGKRTVDDAWQAACAQRGDDAPTQRECVDLISRLQLFGLLDGEAPFAADMIEERRRNARDRKVRQRTGLGFSVSLPLLNPERVLESLAWIIRPVFSPIGAALWCVVVLAGLYSLLGRGKELTGDLNSLIAPGNLWAIALAFTILRAWHELGHACAVKAFGGRCTEIGLMLVALVLPFPYCDTSSSWKFPLARHRVIVGAAGMIFETFLAAIAAILWANSEPGTFKSVMHTVMFVSGITTLVFNLNPLLRYDGYYILSDLAGVPNLAQRAIELWKFLVQKVAFGVKGQKPPSVSGPGEFWLLFFFGLLSYPYRLTVTFAIVLLLWTNNAYLGLGVLIAAGGLLLWFVWPLCRGIWHLVSSSQLVGKRARAIGVSLAAVLFIGAALGIVPAPARSKAWGIVMPRDFELLRAGESGFIDSYLVPPGGKVEAGDPVVVLSNPELESALRKAEAALARAGADLDASEQRPVVERQIAAISLREAESDIEELRARAALLTARAGFPGVVTTIPGAGSSHSPLLGRFVQRGEPLARVVGETAPRVRVLISDKEHAYIFRNRGLEGTEFPDVGASVRMRGNAGLELPGRITRVLPAGSRSVDLAALTSLAGGDILIDPSDPQGKTAMQAQFLVEIELPEEAPMLVGQRARVRFEMPSEPLFSQWWRRLRQRLEERGGA